MATRRCADCGRTFTQDTGRPASRCLDCRGPEATRYGSAHKALRAATIDDAYGTPCCRCGRVMAEGQPLHLDHDEHGGYLGFSHATCNTRAAAVKVNGLRRTGRSGADSQVTRDQAAAGIALPAPPRTQARPCKFHGPDHPSAGSCPHSRDW